MSGRSTPSWSSGRGRARCRSSTCAWTRGTTTPPGHAAAASGGHVPHVRRIGEEKKDYRGRKGRRKARRWVVERTIGWLNRWRGILVRYAKRSANYLCVVKLACALLWYRRLHKLTGE